MCFCTPEIRTPNCGKITCRPESEAPNLAAWEKVEEANAQPLDMEEMDKLVSLYKEAREDYDAKKKISNEAESKKETLKLQVIAALKAAKKTQYQVEGVGKVILVNKFQVTMPKNMIDKKAVFAHFQKEQIHLEYLTVNHQALNGYYNQQREKDPGFKLPGVADPVTETTLQLRKS